MAQPTWRDVAIPGGGDESSAYGTAAVMSKGFDAARKALDDLQASKTTRESNTLAMDLSKFTDSASLDQALKSGTLFGGRDPRSLSTDVINQVLERQGELLANEQTGATIANTRTLGKGYALDNVNKELVNTQLAWTNTKTRDFEAARPEALKAVSEIKVLADMGDPDSLAKARAKMIEYTPKMAAAGFSSANVQDLMNGLVPASSAGQALNETFTAAQNAKTAEERVKNAQAFAKAAVDSSGNSYETTVRMLQDSGLDPELVDLGVKWVNERKDTLFRAPDDRDTVMTDMKTNLGAGGGVRNAAGGADNAVNAGDVSNAIVYANQNATRNLPLDPTLESIMGPISAANGVTMKVISGGQPSSGPNRVGSHRHDDGGAGDVEFYSTTDGHKLDPRNTADLAILSNIVRQSSNAGVTGWGEGGDYMGHGRIHLGFGTPAIWGAGGKGDNAPQWLKDAISGTRPDSGGYAPQAAPIGPQDGGDVTAILNKAQNESVLLTPQEYDTVHEGILELGAQHQEIDNTIQADLMFNQDLSLMSKLSSRDTGKSTQELAIEIAKLVNPEKDPDAATLNDIIQDFATVRKETGLASDMAAEFMKEHVTRHAYGTEWLFGSLDVDKSGLKERVSEFINPDGSLKGTQLKGTTEKMRELQVKTEIQTELQKLEAKVQATEDTLTQALGAKNAGKNVDLKRPTSLHAAAVAAYRKAISKAASNPLLKVSSETIPVDQK